MVAVFLCRYPNGNNMAAGKMSCKRNIIRAPVHFLKIAYEEWISQEGFDKVKGFFRQKSVKFKN
jgi:hypothetical protein